MDMIDGIIVGAAAAAIGSIVAYHFINKQPTGGGAPMQPGIARDPNFQQPAPLYVVDLDPTPRYAAPVVQVNPNQEAAFNVQPVVFEAAFGPDVLQSADPTVLPA